MRKITEEQVNKAFDAYLEAFNALAVQEDELEDMRTGLEDYKEGSPKHAEALKVCREFERSVAVYQRNFRKAALELDRIKTLVSMEV